MTLPIRSAQRRNNGAPLAGPTFRVEPLESRTLLDGTLETWAAAPETDRPGISTVRWNGRSVRAAAGRWILGTEVSNPVDIDRLVRSKRKDVRVSAHLGLTGLSLLEAPAKAGHGRLLRSLRTLPGFRYLEPDVLYTADVTPDDPRYVQMWQLHNTGQTGGVAGADVDAPRAWSATAAGGAEVVVAVLDSGIKYDHPDLAPSMWRNPAEIPGNRVDDDGNGKVDDVHGYDFVYRDGDPMDDGGHGTHVAGTIAAAANNGIGMSGLAWNAKLMALKISDEDAQMSLSDAVAALGYAADMRRRGTNLRVINGSWGGHPYNQSFKDALEAVGREGILCVASAGNGGEDAISDDNDAEPRYPSSYGVPTLISVAATDHRDGLGWFSNYGATTVELGAPGVSILSTVLPADRPMGHASGYRRFSGTSMAAPHVAGAAAMAWGARPDATVAQIKAALVAGADPLPSLAGKTVSGGRLNVANTLRHMGLFMAESTSPAEGAVLPAPPAEFTLHFSQPADPSTVQATDLTVAGRPADAVSLAADNRSATFRFDTPPVTAEGPGEVRVARGAIARASDGEPFAGHVTTFYHDRSTGAAAFSVADGSIVDAPFTALDVTFSEPFDPASLGAPDDLLLDRGNVVAFAPLSPTTVRYTLASLESEGPVGAILLAGAVKDLRGNPMGGATARYEVDIATAAFADAPVDELFYAEYDDYNIYRAKGVDAHIGYAGDSDRYTYRVDAGRAFTARVVPSADLRPTVTLLAPDGDVIATYKAPRAGWHATVGPVGTGAGGTFTIVVAAADAGSVAEPPLAYEVEVSLDLLLEPENTTGVSNDTRAAAQDLDPYFLPRAVPHDEFVGSRALVFGRADPSGVDKDPTGLRDVEPNSNLADAYSLAGGFTPLTGPPRYQSSVRGELSAPGDVDWYDVGVLRAGDTLHASLAGRPSLRGTLADPRLSLYRYDGGLGLSVPVASDDNGGSGDDALLVVPVAQEDRYFLAAAGPGGGAGTYDLGMVLHASTPPLTGGTTAVETEPNDTPAAADDLSAAWRRVGYVATARGDSTDRRPDWHNGTPDFFSFRFTAGDLVTIGPALIDTRIVLRAADGRVLARKPLDDGPVLPRNSVYAYRVPSTGTYYLEVKGSVWTQPGARFGYLIPVYLSTESPPTRGPWQGVDWYQFSAAPGQRFIVTMFPITPGLIVDDPQLRLEDEAGREVGVVNEMLRQTFTSEAGGTYYARVTGADRGYLLAVNGDRVPGPRVVGRHVFYSGSAFDAGGANNNGPGDDAAIAPDKRALLPGQSPTFANVTSHTRGINGVMVDVAGLASTSLTADDFTFRRGAGGDPAGWELLPSPTRSITVRRGAGVGGSDRVTITFPDRAVLNQWLQVTVRGNANTGISADDVFYFGNLVGETGAGGALRVDPRDFALARAAAYTPAPDLANPFDFDRDGRVGITDLVAARGAFGRSLVAPV